MTWVVHGTSLPKTDSLFASEIAGIDGFVVWVILAIGLDAFADVVRNRVFLYVGGRPAVDLLGGHTVIELSPPFGIIPALPVEVGYETFCIDVAYGFDEQIHAPGRVLDIRIQYLHLLRIP